MIEQLETVDLQYTDVTKNIVSTAIIPFEPDSLTRPYLTSRMSCIALQEIEELFFVDCTARADLAQKFREDMEEKYGFPTSHLFLTSEDWHRSWGMNAFKDVKVVISSPGKAFFKKSLKNKYIDTLKEHVYREFPEDEALREVLQSSLIFIPQIGVSKRDFGPTTQKVIFQKLPHTGARPSTIYLPSEEIFFLGRVLSSCFVAFHWPITTPDLFHQWEQLPIKYVVPGNGPIVGKDYLTQIRIYYENLLTRLHELRKEEIKESQLLKQTDFPEYPGKKQKSWIEGSPYHTKVIDDMIRFWYRQILKEPAPEDEDLMFIS